MKKINVDIADALATVSRADIDAIMPEARQGLETLNSGKIGRAHV